jgi:hypothetical protein
MKRITVEPFSLRVAPALLELHVPPQLVTDPGPPTHVLSRKNPAPRDRASAIPPSVSILSPRSDVPAYMEACFELFRAQTEDQHRSALFTLEREVNKMNSHDFSDPAVASLFLDLEDELYRLVDDFPVNLLLTAIRIIRFLLPHLPSTAPSIPRISSVKAAAVVKPVLPGLKRLSMPRKSSMILSQARSPLLPQSAHPPSPLPSGNRQTYKNLLGKSLFLLTQKVTAVEQVFDGQSCIPVILDVLFSDAPLSGRIFACAALVQCASRPGVRATLFKSPSILDLLLLFQMEDEDDTPVGQLFVQLIALLRILADDPSFSIFPIEEVCDCLIRTVRVFPTYHSLVINTFAFLMLFRNVKNLYEHILGEFTEQVILVLSLQILSMSRTAPPVVAVICGWLADLVERTDALASVAARIFDPLDISVCAEFLGAQNEPAVLVPILHLIACFALDQGCATLFSSRKEIPALFARQAVCENAVVMEQLMNVVERITFHLPGYAPPKLVYAIPNILASPDPLVVQMGLRVLCQIATPDKMFLLENQIPERVIGLMDAQDPKICWLAVRGSCHLMQIFEEVKVRFAESGGRQRILQILRREEVCRAVLTALVGLMTVCGQWSEEERAEIAELIRGFEGYESVKQLVEFVAVEPP